MPTRLTIALLAAACLAGFLSGSHSRGWLVVVLVDAAVIMLFLLDTVLAARAGRRVAAERTHAAIVSSGRPEKVSLNLTNRSGSRVVLKVVDALPEVAAPRQAEFAPLRIDPGRARELSYRFTPARRGTYPVGPAVARVRGPLGLAWKQLGLAAPTTIKVYPDIKLIERYQHLLRRSRLKEYGISPAAHPGHGTYFESLREFVEGDDPSRIEWKATARKGKPIVKNYQAEQSQTVFLLVDSGKMMTTVIEGKSRLDYAVDSALLLSHVVISKGDNAGLVLFSEKIHKFLPPMKQAGQIKRIADALHDAGASLIEPDYIRAVRMAAAGRKRSLIIIFTDVWGRESAEELLLCTRNIMPMHLPLIVMMRDRDMERIASGSEIGGRSERAFRAAAACRLLVERKETVARLRSMGALVLDVHPRHVTAGAIKKYLEVKLRHLV